MTKLERLVTEVNLHLDGWTRLYPGDGDYCAWRSTECSDDLFYLVRVRVKADLLPKRYMLVCKKHVDLCDSWRIYNE